MAVQAQYPSNILLPDYRKRAKAGSPLDGRDFLQPASAFFSHVEETQQQQQQQHQQALAANALRMYNTVAVPNMASQTMVNNVNMNELEGIDLNPIMSRKRLRDDDELLARQHATGFVPISGLLQNNPGVHHAVPNLASMPISTGLRLAFEDGRVASSVASTSGRVPSSSQSVSLILSEDIQSRFLKQKEEIDQLINLQGECMKQLLEEKRQMHTIALLTSIEDSVLRKLKEKEEEVQRIKCRNVDLEERVKQLTLESQLWQNLAKNNEAMVSSLRTSLEQVVAQSREHSKEGCGESEAADDAESCNHGDSGNVMAACMVRESRELKDHRYCRVCKANPASILLLPCRHLCLCKECDSRQPDCPICGSLKNASVQVYLD